MIKAAPLPRPLGDPHPLVEQFAPGAPRGRALDLGAGKGHNALYLAAELGFDPVDAIDNGSHPIVESEQILTGVVAEATRRWLTVRTWYMDFWEFDMGVEQYALVLALNSLHYYPERFSEMAGRIEKALVAGGRLILTLLTRTVRIEDGKDVDVHQYPSDFPLDTPAKIARVFLTFDVRDSREVLKRDDPHPGAEYPHVHTILTFVADKPGRSRPA